MTRTKSDIFNGNDPLLVTRTTPQQRQAAIAHVWRRAVDVEDAERLLRMLGLDDAERVRS